MYGLNGALSGIAVTADHSAVFISEGKNHLRYVEVAHFSEGKLAGSASTGPPVDFSPVDNSDAEFDFGSRRTRLTLTDDWKFPYGILRMSNALVLGDNNKVCFLYTGTSVTRGKLAGHLF